jgi:hypothetical protein
MKHPTLLSVFKVHHLHRSGPGPAPEGRTDGRPDLATTLRGRELWGALLRGDPPAFFGDVEKPWFPGRNGGLISDLSHFKSHSYYSIFMVLYFYWLATGYQGHNGFAASRFNPILVKKSQICGSLWYDGFLAVVNVKLCGSRMGLFEIMK